MTTRRGVAWNGSEALRGVASAVPGALVAALFDVGLGCALALGTLCVALLGLPPTRAARARLFAGAALFAGGYALGTVSRRPARFAETYGERLIETAVGSALAILLGVVVPRVLASRHAGVTMSRDA